MVDKSCIGKVIQSLILVFTYLDLIDYSCIGNSKYNIILALICSIKSSLGNSKDDVLSNDFINSNGRRPRRRRYSIIRSIGFNSLPV